MFYQVHHMSSAEYFKREEGEDFSYPPHLHQGFELIIVTEGRMSVEVSGEEHILEEGDSILVFPNELHSLISEHSRHVLFIFSEKLIRAFSVKYASLAPTRRVLHLEESQLRSLTGLSGEDSAIALKGALYSYAAVLEAAGDFLPTYKKREDLLRRIFTFVEDNFRGGCSLCELASVLGYNHAYLSRYFKRVTGVPYNSYVNSRRLSAASYLLLNSDCSVLECAIESGYRSLRTFNRNFRQFFGISPDEYRAKK